MEPQKMDNRELSEHYSNFAKCRLNQMNCETFKDCKSRAEVSEYLLNIFIAYYGLKCTCDSGMDWDFKNASCHYHHCDLWKFCHTVNRCLDWSESISPFKNLLVE